MLAEDNIVGEVDDRRLLLVQGRQDVSRCLKYCTVRFVFTDLQRSK